VLNLIKNDTPMENISDQLIENKNDSKKIFRNLEEKASDPIKRKMVKFLHQNLCEEKDIFKGFFRFKPKDL
jgi:hypothetical protein